MFKKSLKFVICLGIIPKYLIIEKHMFLPNVTCAYGIILLREKTM